MSRDRIHRGFTLLEILLVTGLLTVILAMVMPNLFRDLTRARLPESAHHLRALVQMTRAHAMLDGRRHRIRFPRDDEIDGQGESIQPIVEVERDALEEPEEFTPVLAAWAQGMTLKRDVRCARVRLGKPTVDRLLGEDEEELEQTEDELAESLGERFEQGFPPLIFETDGTSEWATFVLTDASPDVAYEELDADSDEYRQMEVILDGLIGLAWVQRPLYEEELDMMLENGWPPVMRRDFLSPVPLTEDDVLELRESLIRR